MSQLDLIAEIRASRPTAPAELRARVRELAATRPAPRRRLTWRRALVVVVPVAAAAALAATFLPRRHDRTTAIDAPYAQDTSGRLQTLTPSATHAATPPIAKATSGAERLAPTAPPTSRTRAQRYSATLTVRLPTASAVSAATTRALRIAAALGGYPQTVRVDAAQKDASAYIVVKVPRNRVQDAVRRLGALGTIVGENVAIQDLQAGVDTAGRKIARLQAKLNVLRAAPPTAESAKQVAALKTQLERLRLARAAT